jgi:hypothetical protein
MSEKTEITSTTVGYHFSITVEREIRTETGAKYPDKSVVTASLSGNAPSFEVAVEQAKTAKAEIEKLLAEKKPTEEKEKA